MAVWRQTEYTELVGGNESPAETMANGQSRAVRELLLKNGSLEGRRQAYIDFLGYPFVDSAVSGTGTTLRFINRVTPHPYPLLTPDFPGKNWLHANSMSNSRPIGVVSSTGDALSPVGQASNARVTVQYLPLTYEVLPDSLVLGGPQVNQDLFTVTYQASPLLGKPDEGYWLQQGWGLSRYVTKRIKMGGRFITLPAGFLRYVDGTAGGTATGASFPINEGYEAIQYVWHQVPYDGVPFSSIANCLGRVNGNRFDSHAPETLLFESVDLITDYTAVGVRAVDVIYSFRYLPRVLQHGLLTGSPAGHNSTPRVIPGTGTWDYVPVSIDGSQTGDHPYRAARMDSLFRPDQPS